MINNKFNQNNNYNYMIYNNYERNIYKFILKMIFLGIK